MMSLKKKTDVQVFLSKLERIDNQPQMRAASLPIGEIVERQTSVRASMDERAAAQVPEHSNASVQRSAQITALEQRHADHERELTLAFEERERVRSKLSQLVCEEAKPVFQKALERVIRARQEECDAITELCTLLDGVVDAGYRVTPPLSWDVVPTAGVGLPSEKFGQNVEWLRDIDPFRG